MAKEKLFNETNSQFLVRKKKQKLSLKEFQLLTNN